MMRRSLFIEARKNGQPRGRRAAAEHSNGVIQ